MKNILTRRYSLSDFMYDSYEDDITNLYNGTPIDKAFGEAFNSLIGKAII